MRYLNEENKEITKEEFDAKVKEQNNLYEGADFTSKFTNRSGEVIAMKILPKSEFEWLL